MLQSWGQGEGRREVCVKCDYRKKNKVIKHSEFGWKFKSNLLTWRAAKSTSIYSPVSQAGGLRRSPGLRRGIRSLDYDRHA